MLLCSTMNTLKFLVSILPVALAADLFVATDGSSSGSGSIDSPYLSMQDAIDAASPGDTIHIRGGTYKPSDNISFRKSGTSSSPYTVRAHEDEEVIFDGDNLFGTPVEEYEGSLPSSKRGIFQLRGANYWRFFNLTFTKGPYGVYVEDSSNNYFERITTHTNYESGFHLQNDISNTEIVFLDSYFNFDPRKNGKSADGISLKEGSGDGNVIRGARIWHNSDDGIDLWQFGSPVTILDCLVFENGFDRWDMGSDHEADGNGVKLGGGSSASDRTAVNHVVKNTISFGNKRRGFTDNNMPGDMTFERNTAYKNGEEGFNTRSSVATYTENIAAENAGTTDTDEQYYFVDGVKSTGNSWDGGDSWSDASFVSVDTKAVTGPRAADGRLPANDFLVPTNNEQIGARTADWAEGQFALLGSGTETNRAEIESSCKRKLRRRMRA
ncbi:pectate lyase [Colletotrichum truncatum]|uniref:Pectate lyase n=1 Tax=Colletotrichum truncatum TaxID=5467 RepID=A0ACC3Z7C8_COLTU|nr:pectate lyase [Colletotrichum truncatum]KAF6785360.1 pectate lyase [Colletotrichum truncatum]